MDSQDERRVWLYDELPPEASFVLGFPTFQMQLAHSI